jgi:hypothetical protein
MAKDNMDPAFPSPGRVGNGLTKREYYAAMALQPIISRANTDTDTIAALCKMAFAFADRMIEESKFE